MKALFAPLAMALVAGVLLLSPPAHADRPPTAQELARIEQTLRDAGFVRWDEIELDDDTWEVDDAVDADGREWDVSIDPETFEIVEREED